MAESERLPPERTELLLSDITLMGPGYCVIGLSVSGQNAPSSLRPMPLRGFAWQDHSLARGEYLHTAVARGIGTAPHIEDRQTIVAGLNKTGRHVSESALVEHLRRAEMADSLGGLFGCPVQPSPYGGPAVWVAPGDAFRSVCGCAITNIYFDLSFQPRAEITLGSRENLRSIPLVDRDWNSFAATLKQQHGLAEAEGVLNGRIRERILGSANCLVRVGLPRPKNNMCWLMLDSLFPQPSIELFA